MSNIMFFSIPAHGHTNPMINVAAELAARGHNIRFYSFREFKEKIEKTGAQYVECDNYLPELSDKHAKEIKKASTVRMTIVDLETTAKMDGMLKEEVKKFKPDLIYSDSVCFWGRLTAIKYNIPMICSITTIAFNKYSSKYLKNSFTDTIKMIFGMFPISAALNKLKPLGYDVKSPFELIAASDNQDSVVYTSRKFQPFAETFSDNYIFAGPSVRETEVKNNKRDKKTIYISLGTVMNENINFVTIQG